MVADDVAVLDKDVEADVVTLVVSVVVLVEEGDVVPLEVIDDVRLEVKDVDIVLVRVEVMVEVRLEVTVVERVLDIVDDTLDEGVDETVDETDVVIVEVNVVVLLASAMEELSK